jgi:hypothetical protein
MTREPPWRLYPETAAAVEVPLLGGDVSVGVVRVGDTVRRPLGPNSAVIHAVLEHLEHVGFAGAPRYLGVDGQDREVLSFVDGEVAGRPRPSWIGDEDRLRSVAVLLRDYHQAMAGFVLPEGLVPDWGIPDLPGLPDVTPARPVEVLGHQDVTPENVVFVDGRAEALIDFDLVKPVTRLQDVVNALVWWAPFADPADRYPQMADLDAAHRCRVFADAYGLGRAARHDLVEVATSSSARSRVLMKHRADTMGGGWLRMWDEGVGDTILRRQRWLETQGHVITAALLAEPTTAA